MSLLIALLLFMY